MNKIYSVLFLVGGISILTIIAFAGMSDDGIVVSDSKKVVSYIPSNITKANPNILIGSGDNFSIKTTNISDVADSVVYTIQGTVLRVDDPISWITVKDSFLGQGSIPVTITVEKVYKGQLDAKTFTFFLTSVFLRQNDDTDLSSSMSSEDKIIDVLRDKTKKQYLTSDSGQFEIGKKVIVHISERDFGSNKILDYPKNLERLTPYYYLTLGEYSVYDVQNNMAFNNKYPTGTSIDFIIEESQ